MSIKKNIKQLREKKNMSQELLAERMDVTRQAVSKWESGESKPSTQNLIELAKIFNISVDELIADSDIIEKEKTVKKDINRVKILSILSLMLSFVPFAVAVIAHKFLPETIPMHYNGAGAIDRYGNKNELLILAGCLSLFVIAVTIAIIVIKHNKTSKTTLMLSSIAMSITFIIMQIIFTIMAIDNAGAVTLKSFEIMQIVCISVNVLMIFFGIALPFTRQNLIFGFRITSTLNSKDNWAKTHKLAGITVVIGGTAGALFAALISGYIALFSLAFLVVAIVIPAAYSLMLEKKN